MSSIIRRKGAYIPINKFRGFTHKIGNHPFAPNFQNWYDDCFYNIRGAKTFEQRFELVKQGQYFCFSKPALKLIAEELKED